MPGSPFNEMVRWVPLSEPIIQYMPLSDTVYIIIKITVVQYRITFEFLIDKLDQLIQIKNNERWNVSLSSPVWQI